MKRILLTLLFAVAIAAPAHAVTDQDPTIFNGFWKAWHLFWEEHSGDVENKSFWRNVAQRSPSRPHGDPLTAMRPAHITIVRR